MSFVINISSTSLYFLDDNVQPTLTYWWHYHHFVVPCWVFNSRTACSLPCWSITLELLSLWPLWVTWFLEYGSYRSYGFLEENTLIWLRTWGVYGMVLKVMSLTSCWTDENVAGISERYSEKFLKGFRTPENFRVVWSCCLRTFSWTCSSKRSWHLGDRCDRSDRKFHTLLYFIFKFSLY